MKYTVTSKKISCYAAALRKEERTEGTIENYIRAMSSFERFLDGSEASQEKLNGWKIALREQGYAPVTVNARLAAVNGFCKFMDWPFKAKYLKVQRRLFRSPDRELTLAEYMSLLHTAHIQGKEQIAFLMETMCSTGIRVSEVKYITAEAVEAGQTDIEMKGKIRTILLPEKLCRKLLEFAEKEKRSSGEIFTDTNGKSISRGHIWRELKGLCAEAGVPPEKVFPHNLRHLFADVFYRSCHDIAGLADLLGHSSIETTRIYIAVSGDQYRKRIEGLGLVS